MPRAKLPRLDRSLALRLWWILPPLVAAAVYANTLTNDFVWDDFYLILEDHTIKSFKYLSVIFSSDFFGHQEDDLAYGYFRPLVSLSYAVDYAIWQRNPIGYHLTNILLHGGATLLVALLLTELGLSRKVSLFSALLFAVHPMHTENTAWISGRTDSLSFLLAGTAFLLHLLAARREHSALLYIPALAAFLAALLAKEMAVVLIPWIGIVTFQTADKKALQKGALAMLPYIAVVGVYLVLRFVVANVPGPAQRTDISIFDRLLAAPWTALRYLAWLLLPIQQSAYVQNPYMSGPGDLRLYVGFLGVAAVCVGAVRYRKRFPRAAMFFWMTAVSFGPILNFVSASGPADMGAIMAERFLYFPSFPFVALIGLLAESLIDHLRSRPKAHATVIAGCAAALVALSGATIARNRDWQNNEIFYKSTLRRVVSPLILCNLANHYIYLKRLDEAEKLLIQARKLTSDDYHFLSAKALLHVVRKEYKDAIALQLKVAKKAKRGRPVAYNNLAFLYRATGEYKRAEALLREVIDNDRGYADVYFNLAEVYRAEGRIDAATQAFREALRRRPDSLPMTAAFAAMLIDVGDLKGAASVFEAALDLYRNDPGLLNNLGVVYKKMKQPGRARELFEKALDADPTYEKARLNLAGALLALQLKEAAMKELRRIIHDHPDSPEAKAAASLAESSARSPAPNSGDTPRDRSEE